MNICTCTHTHIHGYLPVCTAAHSHTHAHHKNTASLQSTGRSLISWCKTRTLEMKLERKKKCVVCKGVCPYPSKKHPASPLRNPCLCILKSFCCCGCYCCCFRAPKPLRRPFRSQMEEQERFSEWQLLCCMIYYWSKVRTEALVDCDSQVDTCCHFLSEMFVVWTVTHL